MKSRNHVGLGPINQELNPSTFYKWPHEVGCDLDWELVLIICTWDPSRRRLRVVNPVKSSSSQVESWSIKVDLSEQTWVRGSFPPTERLHSSSSQPPSYTGSLIALNSHREDFNTWKPFDRLKEGSSRRAVDRALRAGRTSPIAENASAWRTYPCIH